MTEEQAERLMAELVAIRQLLEYTAKIDAETAARVAADRAFLKGRARKHMRQHPELYR